MRKIISILFLFLGVCIHSQNINTLLENDSISYDKNVDYVKKRKLGNDLTSKYKGKDFIYTENTPTPKKTKKETEQRINEGSLDFFKDLISFMGTVFPYLLALIVILILLKSFVFTEIDFWKFNKSPKQQKKALIFEEEEEDINNNNYGKLLERAIHNNDYRLATRYYYLLLLKLMSQKGIIKYDKDKTNSEYLFELKNINSRKQFSYLLYLYDYVWYGEFPIDELKFNAIENNYKSYIKKL